MQNNALSMMKMFWKCCIPSVTQMHLKFNGSGMYYLHHEPLLAVIGPTGKNSDDLQDPGSQEVHFLKVLLTS